MKLKRDLHTIWLVFLFLFPVFVVAEETLIVPGLSVGKVKLGQTREEIKKILGTENNKHSFKDKSWSFKRDKYDPSIRVEFKSDKVYAIHFFDPFYKTVDGKGVDTQELNYKGYARTQYIDPAELPSGKKNRTLRFVHPSGGLAFYKYDVDHAEEEERDLEFSGAVFEGKFPPYDKDYD